MSNEPIPARNPDKGRMLPGVAGIAMFLLLFTLINVFAALRNTFGTSAIKFGILAICTILVVGIFGLLRMRRWGYSIVLAGCLLLSASYFYVFSRIHAGPLVVQGCFMLVFFFYMVRPEVRDRML
jgi:hypothetical protein